MSRADDLRSRMERPATSNEQAEQEAPPARTPKMSPYKGTFTIERPTAKQLRLASAEHDVSITRLVEAAIVTMLDDPRVMDSVLDQAETLATDRDS